MTKTILSTPDIHRKSLAHFLASKFISTDALHEADGMRVELVGLASQAGHGEGNPESHPAKVAHLRMGTGMGMR